MLANRLSTYLYIPVNIINSYSFVNDFYGKHSVEPFYDYLQPSIDV